MRCRKEISYNNDLLFEERERLTIFREAEKLRVEEERAMVKAESESMLAAAKACRDEALVLEQEPCVQVDVQ